MRREDMQTLVVLLFESGLAPSQVDRRLGLAPGFAHDAVLYWWELMGERGSL